MREFASNFGLKRLFSFSVVAAVACAMLMLSGCGHKCRCNSCKTNTCNTCSTCGVSDASTNSCSTCTACNTGNTQYERVGVAPQSLSEAPVVQSQQTAYQGPQYSTSNNYQGSNVSLDRVGETKELPIFSAPANPAPIAVQQSVQPQQPAAAFVQQEAPVRGGGQYHTLQQGETVYALSRKYNVKAKTILEANHFSDPNHLSVGTKVYIPNN